VAGVDGVLPGFGEHVELGGVGVAVDEERVVGVDGPDRGGQALVERAHHGAGLVRRLVHQVVARHPDVVLVTVGDRLPQMDDAVLEVPVLPEQRAVRGVVGVPVLVLGSRQRVQVDDRRDAVRPEGGDRPVEVAEAVLGHLERAHVVLEVAVVEGDPHRVETDLGQEGGVGLTEEAGEEPLEEELVAVVADRLADGRAHHRLVRRVAGDEVLHVEPAAEAHPPHAERLAVDVEQLGSVGADVLQGCGGHSTSSSSSGCFESLRYFRCSSGR
jgi:hypothetical protein